MSKTKQNNLLVVFYPPLVGRKMPRPIVMYEGVATNTEEVLGHLKRVPFHEELREEKAGGQVYIGWADEHDPKTFNGRISWWGTSADGSAEDFFSRYLSEFFAKQSECVLEAEAAAVA